MTNTTANIDPAKLVRERRVTETNVTRRILSALNAIVGCKARKVYGSAYSSGWPDIIGCHRGHMFALEVKTSQRRRQVQGNQSQSLAEWAAVGAAVGVVTSPTEAISIVTGTVGEPTP